MGLAFFVFSHNYPIESLSSSVTRVWSSFGCGLGTNPRMATRQLISGLMMLKKQNGR